MRSRNKILPHLLDKIRNESGLMRTYAESGFESPHIFTCFRETLTLCAYCPDLFNIRFDSSNNVMFLQLFFHYQDNYCTHRMDFCNYIELAKKIHIDAADPLAKFLCALREYSASL